MPILRRWGVVFLAVCRNGAVIVTSLGTKIPLQGAGTFSLLWTCSLLPSEGPGWRLAKENVKDSTDDIFLKQK